MENYGQYVKTAMLKGARVRSKTSWKSGQCARNKCE